MVALVVLGVFALMVVGLGLYVAGLYNGLVTLENNVAQAWSNIDVILKQRHDEIPKLVKVCEGYMNHERETLERVIRARNQASQASSVADTADAEAGLQSALRGLFAVVERYPDLKANENFLGLQRRISTLEDQISDRRELYNAAVNLFNIRIRQIPDVFVARPAGYQPKDLYKASVEDRQDVEIDFSGGQGGTAR